MIQIELFDMNFQVGMYFYYDLESVHNLPQASFDCNAINFVEIVYDGVLDLFLYTQEDACRLVLMKDGNPTHRSKTSAIRRENHKIEKLVWSANLVDLNPIENV